MLEKMNCVNSIGFYNLKCTHIKSLCAKPVFLLCRDGHYKARKFRSVIYILECIVFFQWKSKHSWHDGAKTLEIIRFGAQTTSPANKWSTRADSGGY